MYIEESGRQACTLHEITCVKVKQQECKIENRDTWLIRMGYAETQMKKSVTIRIPCQLILHDKHISKAWGESPYLPISSKDSTPPLMTEDIFQIILAHSRVEKLDDWICIHIV